jgi:hypothetical protein
MLHETSDRSSSSERAIQGLLAIYYLATHFALTLVNELLILGFGKGDDNGFMPFLSKICVIAWLLKSHFHQASETSVERAKRAQVVLVLNFINRLLQPPFLRSFVKASGICTVFDKEWMF